MVEVVTGDELLSGCECSADNQASHCVVSDECFVGDVPDFLEELVGLPLPFTFEPLGGLTACSDFPMTWLSNERMGIMRSPTSRPMAARPRSITTSPNVSLGATTSINGVKSKWSSHRYVDSVTGRGRSSKTWDVSSPSTTPAYTTRPFSGVSWYRWRMRWMRLSACCTRFRIWSDLMFSAPACSCAIRSRMELIDFEDGIVIVTSSVPSPSSGSSWSILSRRSYASDISCWWLMVVDGQCPEANLGPSHQLREHEDATPRPHCATKTGTEVAHDGRNAVYVKKSLWGGMLLSPSASPHRLP